jgi:pimeloyl-ACP methyl ester carboxylesterase
MNIPSQQASNDQATCALPPGLPQRDPYLIVKASADAIAFYRRAFGAAEIMRLDGPHGKVWHAEIQIGDARVMLADEHPELGFLSPQTLGGAGVSLLVYVADVDAVFTRRWPPVPSNCARCRTSFMAIAPAPCVILSAMSGPLPRISKTSAMKKSARARANAGAPLQEAGRRNKLTQPDPPRTRTMPFALSDNRKIHYQVEGNGPPLLLHHGFTSSLEAWRFFGFTAVREHLPGHPVRCPGPWPERQAARSAAYTQRQRCRDALAVLDATGVERAHFFGYSLGGWVGYGLVRHAPQRLRSLILGAAHPYEDRSWDGFHGIDGRDPEAFIATFEALLDEQISPQVKMLIRANDLVALAAAAQQPRPRSKTCWPAWTCPACSSVATPMRAMPPYSARLRSCHRQNSSACPA